jgi:hypothetical protein
MGAEGRVRVMLDAGYDVDVLGQLIAEAAGLPEVDRASHEDAANLRMLGAIVDGAAELALEKEPLIERNAPGETGEAIARLAAGVDHPAQIEAGPEKPAEPGVVGRTGKRERGGQQFDRRIDRGAFVVNPVVGEDADADFIDDVDISARKSDSWLGHDRRRRRRSFNPEARIVICPGGRNRERSQHESRKYDRSLCRPHSQPRFRSPYNLNRGA